MNSGKLVQFPSTLVVGNAVAHECDLENAVEFGAKDLSSNQGFSNNQGLLSKQIFSLCLDDFDGPIDLLLHLVKRSELPIEKLSLAKVADQFLQCIKDTIVFDLELAGEYLVIAANLLSIKAALLLDPKADQQIEGEEGPNPHDELLRRLREAEIYQEAARNISSKDQLGIDVFSPAIAKLLAKSEASIDPGLAQHDSSLLAKAFSKILSAIPSPIGLTINWSRISIGDRMQYFVERLKSKPGEMFTFEELLAEDLSLPIVVSSFVALLELCKRQVIKIKQDAYQDSISLCLIMSKGEEYLSNAVMAGSEFDVASDQPNLAQVGNVS